MPLTRPTSGPLWYAGLRAYILTPGSAPGLARAHGRPKSARPHQCDVLVGSAFMPARWQAWLQHRRVCASSTPRARDTGPLAQSPSSARSDPPRLELASAANAKLPTELKACAAICLDGSFRPEGRRRRPARSRGAQML
nr:MAG TPA: hypothetical protein [Caudoviricetes sp.]